MTINSSSIKSTEFSFNWKEPTKPKGVIEEYSIAIKWLEFLYEYPDYCEELNQTKDFKQRINETSFTFKNALPYSNYSISIQAINGDQVGEESLNFLSTEEGKNN